MGNIKRTHSPAFKAKVALELIREADTAAAVCSRYSIHPTQAGIWKTQALNSLEHIFAGSRDDALKQKNELIEELYKQIGQLKVELDWLKKDARFLREGRIRLIEPEHPKISIVKQCELLDINRSTFYCEEQLETPENISLMRRIDEIYTKFPYYGSPRITAQLKREGLAINHKRVERLMRIMVLEALYPKPNTSKPRPEHHKYQYLLKGLDINRPNQVWGTDITYIRAEDTWFYLTAILDWFSRYVLSWKLSPSQNVEFCLVALNEALAVSSPEIHNSDQGSQFTDKNYIGILRQRNILISMDSRGRCFDNIFTERLWRTVKYEEVYPHDYRSYEEAEISLTKYFKTYNTERLHQALNYQTPAEVYFWSKNKNQKLKILKHHKNHTLSLSSYPQ